MQVRPVGVEHGPIRQQRHCHRRESTPSATFIHPIPDYAGTHRAVANRSERNLADDAPLMFHDEHHPGAVTLVTAQPPYPHIERHRLAVQRIARLPRTQPGIVAPAHLIPFVVIIRSKRTQPDRYLQCLRLYELRHGDGIGPYGTYHVAECLENGHAPIVPPTAPPSRSIQHVVIQQAIWTRPKRPSPRRQPNDCAP